MPNDEDELAALRDQLADALAEIERLQAQAADAEARAATLKEELEDTRALIADKDQQLATAQAELAEARSAQAELVEALHQAALKYRQARLAASPDVPAELIPGETMEEIDKQFEAALGIVSHLRDRLESQSQASRIPIGAPPRRPPDLSALSASEKIKLGLARR